MKKIFVIATVIFVSNLAGAIENDNGKALADGKANYFCTINRQNPKDPSTYDQTVVSGSALVGGVQSEYFYVTTDNKILSADKVQNSSIDDWRKLEGALVFGLQVTDDKDVKSDLQKNLTIVIERIVKIPAKIPENKTLDLGKIVAIASGYYRGAVSLNSMPEKISINCFHKDSFPKN